MATSLELLLKRAEVKPNENRFYTPAQLTQLESVIQTRMGAVCQIRTPTDKGTGCLIGGNLLITNYHVIQDVETAQKSEVLFFRVIAQDAEKNKTTVEVVRLKLDPTRYFYQSPNLTKDNTAQPADRDHLDFTIVALAPDPYLEQVQERTFDLFKSIEPQIQSLTCALQHPDVIDSTTSLRGDLKWTIGLVQKIENCSVLYDTETAPGSSGGAVVNIQGDLVALHHQGMGKRDLDPRHPYCNAGVLVTEIVRYLERKGERARIEQLIAKYKNEHPFLEAKLTETLRTHYKTFDTISLFFDEDETLPIQNYAPLLMIGDDERKEKRQDLDARETLGKSTHEALFESKKSLNLELLFERETLKEKRVLVLGGAGIGKSTLCQYIAYQWAVGKLWPQFKAVFWVKLRYLSKGFYPEGREYRGHDLLAGRDLKHRGIKLEDYSPLLDNEHFRENTLLIFDGEDELPSEAERGHLSIALNELKEKFPHILITSRHQGLPLSEKKERATVEILGFDEGGVNKYIGDFFDDPEKKMTKAEQNLRIYIRQFPIVRSLAHIPLNLAILCRLFKERENPFDIKNYLTVSCLYEKITAWICKRFLLRPGICQQYTISDIVQEYHPENFDEVAPLMRALKAIAWEAMKNDRFYLTEAEVNFYFGKFKLKVGQNRNFGLFKIDQCVGSFIHLTFQEYFAALYLADLYLTGRNKEGRDFIVQHKFTPRYATIFWMTAGYLSTKDEEALQAFFTDLLSEPYDLAVGCELRLLARCFEECKDARVIPQYEKFVEQVLIYLHEQPSERLKANLFVGNPRLLCHEKIVQFFLNNLMDQAKQDRVCRALKMLAEEGQILSEIMILKVVDILRNPQADSTAKGFAAMALGKVAKSGQALPKLAVEALLQLLKDPQANLVNKKFAAMALSEIAGSGQALPQETVDILFAFLKKPQVESSLNDSDSSDSDDEVSVDFAAGALGSLAMSDQTLSKEAVIVLLALLKDPQVDSNAKCSAVSTLSEIVKSGQALPIEAGNVFLLLLRDPQTESNTRRYSAWALGELAKSRQFLLREVLDVFFAILNDPKAGPPWVKQGVTEALGKMAKSKQVLPKETINVLFAILKDPKADSDIQQSAAKTLGKVAESGQAISKEAVDALFEILKDPQVDSKFIGRSSPKHSAALALGKVAKSGQAMSKEALDVLLTVLKDPQADSKAKQSAAEALGNATNGKLVVPKKEIEEVMSKFFTDPQAGSWERYLTGNLGGVVKRGLTLPKEAVDALLAILKDSQIDYSVTDSAVQALGKMAKNGQAVSQEAIDILLAILRDPQWTLSVKRSVAETLLKMVKSGLTLPKEALGVPLALLKNPQTDSNTKHYASRTLAEVAKSGLALSKEAVDILFGILRDPQAGYQAMHSAARALAEVEKSKQALPKEVLEALLMLLKDPKAGFDARFCAAVTLAEVERSRLALPKEAVDVLLMFFKETHSWEKADAAKALGEMAKSGHNVSKEVVDVFSTILKDGKFDSYSKYIKEFVSVALEEIAKSGQAMSNEAVEALITIFNEGSAYIGENTLNLIAGESCKFSNQYDYHVLSKLFFITNRAFFYQNDAFYTSGNPTPLINQSPVDRMEVYRELLTSSKLHSQK